MPESDAAQSSMLRDPGTGGWNGGWCRSRRQPGERGHGGGRAAEQSRPLQELAAFERHLGFPPGSPLTVPF